MEKKDLRNITLTCVNGVDPDKGVKALKYSMQKINFARAIIFSHIKPSNLTEDIEFIQIEELDHRGSCLFALKTLYNYIDTDFCLSIHDDGFVINPHLWDEEFLQYDYIGAPWVNHYVGNGGFCLKSKKFMALCQYIPWDGEHDDTLTCITYRHYFTKYKCKFAPLDVAMRFSLESKLEGYEYNLDNCFGFHGRGEVYDVFKGEGQQFKDKIKLLDEIE